MTDSVCEWLAELQLTLGEGPCHEALATAAPVLVADLSDPESGRRWPAFAAEARQAGAAAIFAFPLAAGAIRAGAMGLYRDTAGPLSDRQVGDGLILADLATVLLLGAADHGDPGPDGAVLDGQAPDLARRRAEIDQATGILTEQLDTTAAGAFARLRAYAYANDRRLAEVAGRRGWPVRRYSSRGGRTKQMASVARNVVGFSATVPTTRPALRARSTLGESARRPTRTSTPESLRLSAWAWPCEP